MIDLKVKLIRMPFLELLSPTNRGYTYETPHYPPLALSVLSAYLRSKRVFVDQDDLNIKFYYRLLTSKKKIDLNIFYDKKRVINCLQGKKDTEFDKIVDDLLAETNLYNFDLFGLSLPWGHSRTLFLPFLLAKRIKELYPKTKIVLGGGVLNRLMDFSNIILQDQLFNIMFIKKKIIDFLVIGAGEETLYTLVSFLSVKKIDLKEIPGLLYFDGKIYCKRPKRRESHPQMLKPDFNGLPIDLYRWSLKKSRFACFDICKDIPDKDILVLPFYFITGCPFECAFCNVSANKEVNVLPYETAVRYLRELSIEYNTQYFTFYNRTINFSSTYVNQFCDEILRTRLRIKWVDSASFRGLDKKLLEKMKESGCMGLIFGFETGSRRLQKYIDKNLNLDMVSNNIKDAHNLGIWIHLEVIGGLPTENDEDIEETISFLKRHEKYLNQVYITDFIMEKGSKFEAMPEKYGVRNIGLIDCDYYAAWDESSLSFDETEGYMYKQKKKQIRKSCLKLRKNVSMIKVNTNGLMGDNLNFLYFLFSHYKIKSSVERVYYCIIKQFLFKIVLFGISFNRLKKCSIDYVWRQAQLYIGSSAKWLLNEIMIKSKSYLFSNDLR